MRERLAARPGHTETAARNDGREGAGRRGWRTAGLVSLVALAVAPAQPDLAAAQEAPESEPVAATISLRVKGAGGGDVTVGRKARVVGVMRPFVAGQRVRVVVKRGHQPIKSVSVRVRRIEGRNAGTFSARTPSLIRPGRYRFVASHPPPKEQSAARAETRRFSVAYPDLDRGDRGQTVAIFNRLLARGRYHTSRGHRYGGATERAVMAFRKVNGMPRSYDASRSIFKRLAAGRGGFRLAHPRAGRHVEVDISRQVMVLAARGRARHIFHVSTGAPGTPSDRGRFRFYRREPGLNNLGMYYSVYYNGGEAIHGYHSVPPWAASHGCIRNPIPNSRFIYDWVRLGMRIYVYS